MKQNLVKIHVCIDRLDCAEIGQKVVYRLEGLIQKEWIVIAADMFVDKSDSPRVRQYIREDQGASDYRVTVQFSSQKELPYILSVEKGECDWK